MIDVLDDSTFVMPRLGQDSGRSLICFPSLCVHPAGLVGTFVETLSFDHRENGRSPK